MPRKDLVYSVQRKNLVYSVPRKDLVYSVQRESPCLPPALPKRVERTRAERWVLKMIDHPFIMKARVLFSHAACPVVGGVVPAGGRRKNVPR